MVDKKELQIVAALRYDARMQMTQISKRTGVPISTIYDRIKSNRSGLVNKNTALVDFGKLGLGCRAYMALRTNKNQREAMREHLRGCFNVNSLYRINNGYDFMIDAVFRNVRELEDFIDKLEDNFRIKELKSYYVIDEIFREKVLSDPLDVGLIENA